MRLKSSFGMLLAPDGVEGGSGIGSTVGAVAPAPVASDSDKMVAAAQAAATAPVKTAKSNEPPASALEGDFSMADAEPFIDDSSSPAVVKPDKVPPKKPDAIKPEPAKVAPATPAPKGEPVKSGTPAPINPADTKGRDYAGFTTEETAALKKMPNDAFSFASAKLKELKQLQQQGATSYLQHPDAYKLQPEFQQSQRAVEDAETFTAHWKQQLINIRQGKPWKGLERTKDGQLVETAQAYKATDEAEIDVNNAMMQAAQVAQTEKGKLGGYQQKYKTELDNSNVNLTNERAARFAWVADPKLLDEKVNIGDKEVTVKQIREDLKNMFAPHFRASPLMDLVQDMFVAVQIVSARNRILESQSGAEQKLATNAKLAEPVLEGGTNVNSGKGSKADFIVDMSESPVPE